jgi:hypothetical protein
MCSCGLGSEVSLGLGKVVFFWAKALNRLCPGADDDDVSLASSLLYLRHFVVEPCPSQTAMVMVFPGENLKL